MPGFSGGSAGPKPPSAAPGASRLWPTPRTGDLGLGADRQAPGHTVGIPEASLLSSAVDTVGKGLSSPPRPDAPPAAEVGGGGGGPQPSSMEGATRPPEDVSPGEGGTKERPKLDICISSTYISKTNTSNYTICIFSTMIVGEGRRGPC